MNSKMTDARLARLYLYIASRRAEIPAGVPTDPMDKLLETVLRALRGFESALAQCEAFEAGITSSDQGRAALDAVGPAVLASHFTPAMHHAGHTIHVSVDAAMEAIWVTCPTASRIWGAEIGTSHVRSDRGDGTGRLLAILRTV